MKCFIISVVSERGGNLCRWTQGQSAFGERDRRAVWEMHYRGIDHSDMTISCDFHGKGHTAWARLPDSERKREKNTRNEGDWDIQKTK